MEEIREYEKNIPDYIKANDIMLATERIFSIELSKEINKINNGGINKMLSGIRKQILIDLNTN